MVSIAGQNRSAFDDRNSKSMIEYVKQILLANLALDV
jgi:hypothetical protein